MSNPKEAKDKSEITKRQAINKLWERGVLHWKLDKTQKELYDFFHNNERKTTTFLCSRRLGKSYALCVIALELCLKNPNSIVKYLCPTQRMVRTIIKPIIRDLTLDCPKKFQPEYSSKDGVYVFPNGSEIQMAGNDGGNVEKLRGGSSNLCIIDEAGFCDDLKNSVNSVLLPTTLTTSGKVILSSTPPRSPGHEFNDIIRNADETSTLITKTIFDNPRLSPVQINDIISAYPNGVKNPEFRREYLCELGVNEDTAIIPEFNTEKEKEIVKDWVRPPFFDYYVSADLGFKDFTAVLFAYYDFKANKIIIEDELIMQKMTTQAFADALNAKENSLLIDPFTGEKKDPHLRVSDVNWFIINDLQKLHGISFVPTSKDDLEAAVNNTRVLVGSGQVVINPRCKTLIKHIKNGTWRKSESKRQFARSADDGHYDALAALIYLLRNIQWNRSPYPANYDFRGNPNYYQIKKPDNNGQYSNLAKQFKIKKSL
jgi:Terminase large subunit, T4likevirus-type, N-terminal